MASIERRRARVEQHKRRGSFSGVRLTNNGDIVTLLPPFIADVTEIPWEKSGKLRSILSALRFHTTILSATRGNDVQLPAGYTDPNACRMSKLEE
jgi:hypothetical protein